MAQLSDDCFAFGGPMMSVDEAVAIIAARVTAVQDVETVDLRHADGRVLAAAICQKALSRRFRSQDVFRPERRRKRRSSLAMPCASLRARRCLRAPTPC